METNVSTTTTAIDDVISVANTTTMPLSTSGISLTVCFALTSAIATLGNLIILITFAMNKKLLEKNFNVLILNLAITDFTIGVLDIPWLTVENVFGYWPYSRIACALQIYCDWGMTFISIFTLVIISIDRYWATCLSTSYQRYNTRRRAWIYLAIIWTFLFIMWTPAFILDRIRSWDKPDQCGYDIHANQAFGGFVVVAGYHLPSCLMIFCYVSVYWKLRNVHKSVIPVFNATTTTADRTTTGLASAITNDERLSGVTRVHSQTNTVMKPPSTVRENSTQNGRVGSIVAGCEENKFIKNVESCPELATNGAESQRRTVPFTEIKQSPTIATSINNIESPTQQPILVNGECLGHCQSRMGVKIQKDAQVKFYVSSNDADLDLDESGDEDDDTTAAVRVSCSNLAGQGQCSTSRRESRRRKSGTRTMVMNDDVTGGSVVSVAQQTIASRKAMAQGAKEMRVFKTLTLIIAAYLLLWTPFHICSDLVCFYPSVVTLDVYNFTGLFAYVNSAVNPFLYAIGNPQIKGALRRLLTRILRCC